MYVCNLCFKYGVWRMWYVLMGMMILNVVDYYCCFFKLGYMVDGCEIWFYYIVVVVVGLVGCCKIFDCVYFKVCC